MKNTRVTETKKLSVQRIELWEDHRIYTILDDVTTDIGGTF